MLKITQVEPVNRVVTLRLEGRVIGPWVTELLRSCGELLMDGRALKLDLGDVDYADEEGIAALAQLRARGVVLLDSLPFVAERLKAAGLPTKGA
jgi:ABC-type transporter Mla MlaB component